MTSKTIETFKTKFENDPRFSGLISNSRLFEGYVRDARHRLSCIPFKRCNVIEIGHARANLQAEESRSAQVEKLVVDALIAVAMQEA